ncbi:hypothetical protein HAX54_023249, partial [Datura stramonium]|nr:hypothetical protein [Datura stramonium]
AITLDRSPTQEELFQATHVEKKKNELNSDECVEQRPPDAVAHPCQLRGIFESEGIRSKEIDKALTLQPLATSALVPIDFAPQGATSYVVAPVPVLATSLGSFRFLESHL